jgi:tight adherence protein C
VSGAFAFASAALGVVGISLLLPRRRVAGRSGATRLALALGRRLRPGAFPAGELAARIAAAGAPAGLGVRDLMAIKLVAALGGAAIGLLLGAAAPGRLGVATIALGPAAAFLAPDLWLARRARARARAMRRELPGMLDLLRVSVESGLSLGVAVGSVGERTGGPLAREWRTVGVETRLGVPLGRSLEGLTRRAPLPEVQTLVAALERAGRHGAPLGETLASQARGARLARRREIEERAARAAPKIQLVVALLLVPSVLLLVAAALASALIGGGGPGI